MGIIIPVFRGRSYIDATLTSVLADERVTEVLVVDDECPDGTGAYVDARQLPRVRVLWTRHQGVGGARQVGFNALSASTLLVIFLDQDDLLRTEFLDVALAMMMKDRLAVGVVGSPSFIDTTGAPRAGDNYLSQRPRPHRPVLGRQDFRMRCCVNSPGQALLRVEAVRQVGGFRAEMSPSDDWDFWLRLTARAHLRVVDQPLVYIRRHPRNVSLDVRTMRTAERKVRAVALSESVSPWDRLRLGWAFRRSECLYLVAALRASVTATGGRVNVSERALLKVSGHALWSMLGLRVYTSEALQSLFRLLQKS